MNRKTAAGFLGALFGRVLATAVQGVCPPSSPRATPLFAALFPRGLLEDAGL